jgi:CheY-like chemotaxis protein
VQTAQVGVAPRRASPAVPAHDPRRAVRMEGTGAAATLADVLVVDDDVAFANGIASLLQAHGYRTRVAYDGDDALEQLAAHAFDVVLSDIVMPGMIGCTLVQHAHALPGRDDVPFVFMSVLTEGKVRTFFDGSIRYLQKPFDTSQLLAMLGDALRGTTPGGTAPPPAAQ